MEGVTHVGFDDTTTFDTVFGKIYLGSSNLKGKSIDVINTRFFLLQPFLLSSFLNSSFVHMHFYTFYHSNVTTLPVFIYLLIFILGCCYLESPHIIVRLCPAQI